MATRLRESLRYRAAFAVLSLGTAALMGTAHAATCPAGDFEDFVQALRDQPELIAAHVHQPLLLQQVEIQGDQPSVSSNKSTNPARELHGVFARQQSQGLKVTVERPERVVLHDGNGESLIILVFDQKDCWSLKRIEDWSLKPPPSNAIANDPAAIAIRRGDLYNRLASQTPSNSQISLYASALDSYLYGASLGSANAAYAAAGLSLSGQAPQLPAQRLQELLETAAKVIPEAGITLAYFYCDEGESGTGRPCARPDDALQALKDIARLDSRMALVELGNAYASGDVTAPDASRALACYLEAQSKGATDLDNAISDLKAKGAAAQSSIHCF